MQTVNTVPREANANMAMKSCGMMEKRMKEKAIRSMMLVTRVRKKESENSVKLRMSSEMRWSGLSTSLVVSEAVAVVALLSFAVVVVAPPFPSSVTNCLSKA